MVMENKATLAIYGIKDRNLRQYPAYTHDHNVCLMQNGRILQYLSLERYTRKKYDNRLDEFLDELVERKLLQLPDEFDLVSVNSFVGSCFISKGGKIRFECQKKEVLTNDLEKGFGYYQRDFWEGKELNSYLCAQELAHIGSCLPFFGNFKENSLLLHFDGASSVSNFSAFHFIDGKLKLIEYGWDLKYIANFFNDNALVFNILGARPGEHCSVPGKLMGYACLGNHDPEIESWLTSNDYFKENWNNPELMLQSIKENFGRSLKKFNNREPFFQHVAATLQHIFEKELLSKVERLQERISADYLYYSGGCALNIVANTKIVDKNMFTNVFIPPCCNDSGLSIGAAALLEWKKGNEIPVHPPYLNNIDISSDTPEPSDEVISRTAEIIMAKGIVGICNGFGECGPRALGTRSLIALPNCKELARRISMDVKKREWYRPVAPIMLSTVAEKVVGKPLHHLSTYMLLDFEIKREFAADLAGVIHAGNTARIQALSHEHQNPFMFKLLRYLNEKYDILALINTSFNAQGEPIVHTPEMAFESARKMKLNGLVINNQLQEL